MKTIPKEIQETLESTPINLPVNRPKGMGSNLTSWIVTKHRIPFREARHYAALWDIHRKTKRIPDRAFELSVDNAKYNDIFALSQIEVEEFEHLLKNNVKIS